MKKILFIMPNLCGGGAEKVLTDLLKQLDYSRYKVDLLLLDKKGVYLKDVPKPVRLFSLCGQKKMSFLRILRAVNDRMHWKLRNEVLFKWCSWYWKYRKYDVVISFMEGEALRFHTFIQRKDCLNISWVHIDLFHQHWTVCFFSSVAEEVSCYRQMDKIVCVSDDVRKMFHVLFDVPDGKVQVITNLINKQEIISRSKAFDVTKEKFTVCFLGGLSKRADCLVRVARLFKDQGYDLAFWFVGDRGGKEQMEALSRELGVEGSCYFWGYQENPHPLLKASDVYIATSEAEGYSLALCEALCLGKAAVCTQTAGSIELLNKGEYGLVTDHDDTSIFYALKRLVDDPELFHHYERQALKRSEIFNVQQIMNEVYELFEQKK